MIDDTKYPLTPQIEKFYADKNLHIGKQINLRPPGVLPEQIEAAATEVYHEIQEGLKIKPIDICWRVKDKAKLINADRYMRYIKAIQELEFKNNEVLSSQIIKLKLKLYRIYLALLTGTIIASWGYLAYYLIQLLK